MTKFTKLTEYGEKLLIPGNVLRFPAKPPYEELVDCMFFRNFEEGYGLGLIVTSGYKAGHIYKVFENNILHESKEAISTEHVIKKWDKEIYSECEVSEVRIALCYETEKEEENV